jgi:DNA polymerase-3 subunit beta
MKIKILKSNIKDAVEIVKKSIKTNLPILQNVLIEANDVGIFFKTTDMEINTIHLTQGKVDESGKVLIPFNLLSGILSNLQSDNISIETDENSISLSADNYNAKISNNPVEEFPEFELIKSKNVLDIDSSLLKQSFNQVLQSISTTNYNRVEFESVLFKFELNKLKLASTDGYRLSEKTIELKDVDIKEIILVPSATIKEVVRIIGYQGGDNVKIIFNDKQIMFVIKNTKIISRLAEGNFPEYDALIPEKSSKTITFNRENLQKAIKLVSVFEQVNNEITFNIKERNVELDSSSDKGLGHNKYTIDAVIESDPFEVAFNSKFIMNFLDVTTSENVIMGFNDENSPVIMKQNTDDKYIYIIKPIIK